MDENLNEEEMSQHLDTSKERLPIEENTKIINLQWGLHHYKTNNSHLDHFTDQLVQANQRVRENLEEMNTKYVELVQDAEEAVKIRKLAQTKNKELRK